MPRRSRFVRRAGLLALLPLLGSLAWLVLLLPRGRENAPVVQGAAGPLAGPPGGRAAEPSEPAGRGAHADRAPSRGALRTVQVRSSAGLELERVEVRADGAWRVERLEPGGLLSLPPEGPRLVRAVGHLAAAVPEGEDSVTLEPELCLVLESEGLAREVRSVHVGDIEVRGRASLLDALACGFTGEGAFAVAVTWAELLRAAHKPPEIRLVTEDGRLIRAFLREGARGAFVEDLGLGASPRTAVRIVPSCGHEGTRIALWLELPILRPPGERLARPWGELRRQAWSAPLAPEPRARGTVELVAGRRYGASVTCPACGGYGRAFFDSGHAARTVHVALLPSTVLVGRVTPQGLSAVAARWRVADEGRRLLDGVDAMWSGEDQELALDAEGRFRLRLPGSVPQRADCTFPMPATARLTLRAPSGEELAAWTALPGGEVDLGTFAFPMERPRVRLAPGHGFGATRASAPSHVSFLDPRGEPQRLQVAGAVAAGEGLDVFLAAEPGEDPFAGPEPPRDVLVAEGSRAHGFAWSEGGYRRVPETASTLGIECAGIPPGLAGGAEVVLGWTWRGLDQVVGFLDARDVGTRREASVLRPADVEILWWSETGSRPQGAILGRAAPFPAEGTSFHVP